MKSSKSIMLLVLATLVSCQSEKKTSAGEQASDSLVTETSSSTSMGQGDFNTSSELYGENGQDDLVAGSTPSSDSSSGISTGSSTIGSATPTLSYWGNKIPTYTINNNGSSSSTGSSTSQGQTTASISSLHSAIRGNLFSKSSASSWAYEYNFTAIATTQESRVRREDELKNIGIIFNGLTRKSNIEFKVSKANNKITYFFNNDILTSHSYKTGIMKYLVKLAGQGKADIQKFSTGSAYELSIAITESQLKDFMLSYSNESITVNGNSNIVLSYDKSGSLATELAIFDYAKPIHHNPVAFISTLSNKIIGKSNLFTAVRNAYAGSKNDFNPFLKRSLSCSQGGKLWNTDVIRGSRKSVADSVASDGLACFKFAPRIANPCPRNFNHVSSGDAGWSGPVSSLLKGKQRSIDGMNVGSCVDFHKPKYSGRTKYCSAGYKMVSRFDVPLALQFNTSDYAYGETCVKAASVQVCSYIIQDELGADEYKSNAWSILGFKLGSANTEARKHMKVTSGSAKISSLVCVDVYTPEESYN